MPKLSIRKIEVVQSIQSTENDIPLIGGKKTYVRVYVTPGQLPESVQISGELSISDGPTLLGQYLSIRPIRLSESDSLHNQRLDWTKSLNFSLPDNFLGSIKSKTTIKFEIISATATLVGGTGASLLSINKHQNTNEATADFEPDPGMHCRIVVFRHRGVDNQRVLEPTISEISSIRRYVESAFPVTKVRWSDVTVATPRKFRALEKISRNSTRKDEQTTQILVELFKHLLVIRDQDILQGRDNRTLYLGLLADPSGRFGGAAMDSPQIAAPHIVALSSTDKDGQLAAHELGHILGQQHPGIPSHIIHGKYLGQKMELDIRDIKINPAGYLSFETDKENGKVHLGLDTRYRSSNPRVLSHEQWFDLMTYRYPKWVSEFTYSKLLTRLKEINSDEFEVNETLSPRDLMSIIDLKDRPNAHNWSWTVIGEFNFSRKTGRIHYLGPTNYKVPFIKNTSGSSKVAIAWGNGKHSSEKMKQDVYIKDLAGKDGSPDTGVFQHTLSPDPENAQEIDSFKELVLNNHCVKLLINNIEVDQICGGDFKDFQESIINVINKSNTPPDERDSTNQNNYLNLQYSVDNDGYYLHYNWKNAEIEDARILTTIACRRARVFDKDEVDNNIDKGWETISANGKLSNCIWISPVFISDPNNKKEPKTIIQSVYGNKFFSREEIFRQELEFRIGISTGFLTKFVEKTISVSTITCLGNREDSFAHLSHPGNDKSNISSDTSDEIAWKKERRKSNYWYKDTSETYKP